MPEHREPTEQTDPQLLTYEQAKNELRVVIQSLESGSIPLEDTLKLWKRGEALASRCKQILDQAAAQLEQAESVEMTAVVAD